MRARRGPASGTDRVLRRAARRIGLQAAAMTGVVVVLLAGLAMVLSDSAQDAADRDTLQRAAKLVDGDVGDPPPDAWVVLLDGAGQVSATDGLPAPLPDLAALHAAAAGAPVADAELHLDHGHFMLHTQRWADGAVQVVMDLGPSDRRLAALLGKLAVATAAGLVLAGVIGWVLARRVLSPLRRTLALQRQFVADASHELRTPLTVLHTRLQLLRQELATDRPLPDLVDDTTAALRDGDRLVEVVDDLLVAADPLSTSDVQPVALGPLADEVVEALSARATQRGIELVRPSGAVEPAVLASAAALRRALLALLDNAIEHTPPGGTVTVSARSARKSAQLVVADTGPGFDAADSDGLFDRFHSGGQGAGRRHGLGLALANDVAERHGGRIDVHSEPGDGATFVLSIPDTRTRRASP